MISTRIGRFGILFAAVAIIAAATRVGADGPLPPETCSQGSWASLIGPNTWQLHCQGVCPPSFVCDPWATISFDPITYITTVKNECICMRHNLEGEPWTFYYSDLDQCKTTIVTLIGPGTSTTFPQCDTISCPAPTACDSLEDPAVFKCTCMGGM
jgi:hypothetical protein